MGERMVETSRKNGGESQLRSERRRQAQDDDSSKHALLYSAIAFDMMHMHDLDEMLELVFQSTTGVSC